MKRSGETRPESYASTHMASSHTRTHTHTQPQTNWPFEPETEALDIRAGHQISHSQHLYFLNVQLFLSGWWTEAWCWCSLQLSVFLEDISLVSVRVSLVKMLSLNCYCLLDRDLCRWEWMMEVFTHMVSHLCGDGEPPQNSRAFVYLLTGLGWATEGVGYLFSFLQCMWKNIDRDLNGLLASHEGLFLCRQLSVNQCRIYIC